ncbi:hypothetical protein C8Q73DRAFT_654689, partial [Cubamyces lactineus]
IELEAQEIVAPSARNFLYCSNSSYARRTTNIRWNSSCPNPTHFPRRSSKASDSNMQVRTIGKLAAPPSLRAAASTWHARLILGFSDWVSEVSAYCCPVCSLLSDISPCLLVSFPCSAQAA